MGRSDQGVNDRDQLVESIFDLFNQACLMPDGMYSHDFISTYEEAQAFLLREGKITEDQCRIV